MQTYGDIIRKLQEIVKISEEKMKSFSAITSQVYKNNFVRILWYDIDLTFAQEFSDLLDAERTFYLVQTNDNASKKNSELLDVCKKQGSLSNNNTNNYLKLLEILNNSFDKYSYELTEYHGYFVTKEELPSFISLCRKLNVGPCIKLKDLSREDAKKVFKNKQLQKSEQLKRLQGYLGIHEEFVLPIDVIDDDQAQMFNDISSEFNEIIYLGIMGKLTQDMVMELSDIYSKFEFNSLLYELQMWNIFSKGDISEIRRMVNANLRNINSMDKLVEFFVNKDGLDSNSLKAFIPSIGLYNYHYMIDELFKLGVIEFEDYIKNVEELIKDTPKLN